MRTINPPPPIRDSRRRKGAFILHKPKGSRRILRFHPQVYRADGEMLKLPDGEYTVEFSRGPESISKRKKLPSRRPQSNCSSKWNVGSIRRKLGWWSGDHHIHAAGCAHYVKPTEGVLAADMIRHCMGEDLKVGANLTWGPCFDYQKQFFPARWTRFPNIPTCCATTSRFGLWLASSPGTLSVALEGTDLSRRRFRGPLADALPEHAPLGEEARRGCGPAHSGWGLAVKTTNCPITSCRHSMALARTNISSMSLTKCPARMANSCRPSIFFRWWTRLTFGN